MRFKIVWCVLALALVPASVSAQAPNRKDVVQAVSDADPARFACAHQEGRSCKTDWIKAVAWALHQTDSRWGLNGKRGNPNDISMDVVTFRIGPTDRHVQAFDICGACGGGNPSVVWNDITNFSTIGQPGTAIWVQPTAVGGAAGGGGGTPLPAPPAPAPAVDYTPLLNALAAKLDALAVKVDAVAGVAVEARDAARSAEHDAREVNAARMEPQPLPVLSVPCLVGRVPRAFGGSTEARFCPEPQ